MKFLHRSAAVAALATLAFATAACDSKGTKEVKDEAKAIDKSYQAQADLVDATANNTDNAAAAHQQADALRNEGKAIDKHLVTEAKETQKATK